MEIYLVRHGETVWNSKHLLQGRTDIELNENGRELAGITGQALEDTAFDCIFSSPLIRAYETACLIRGHRNIPILRDDRLMEISFGNYEGKDAMKLLHDESDPFHHFFNTPALYLPPEGGESLEQVMERTASFMREVVEPAEKKYKRIMIVGHGAMNRGIMCHVKQHDKKSYWSGDLQKNCGVILFSLEDGVYTVIDEKKVYY